MLWHSVQGAGGNSVMPLWDITTASFVRSRDVSSEEDFPTGVFFKSDGTKMYVIGRTGDDINQYDLSLAWDISTESHISNTSVATDPTDVYFKPDGSGFYICTAIAGVDTKIYQYSLGTDWITSTGTLVQSFDVTATTGDNPQGLFFKPDGTKMYFTGGANDSVYEYTLGTAWNISTATLISSTSLAAQGTGPFGMFIREDGKQMFIADNDIDAIFQYTLTTPWDTSTRSYDGKSFSVADKETTLNAVFFSSDGAHMYITGGVSDNVHQYSLG